MGNSIDVLYFPGDDRAEDASEVVRAVANTALARASELLGEAYAFNWISEAQDQRLTIGLRLLKKLSGDLGIEVLDAANGKVPETLRFLIDADLLTLQDRYPAVTEGDLPLLRDAAKSLLEVNVLVPSTSFMDYITRVGYAYKGATGTLSGKGTPSSINVFARKKLLSDACVRDFKNVVPRQHVSVPVNMAVFVGPEGVVSDDPVLEGTDYTDVKIITSKSKAIIRKAFEYAKDKGIGKVYVTQKANILKESDGGFVDLAKGIASEFDGIALEVTIFDNMLQRIAKNPDWFEVVVTSKFYGSDFLLPLASAMFDAVEEAELGAEVGTFRRFVGQNYDFTKKRIDTRCYRQNNEGFYIGEGQSTDTRSMNFRRITEKNSRNFVRYAMDDTVKRGKKTVFILYSEGLKGDEIFMDVARKIAGEDKYAGLDIRMMQIKDYCRYTVEQPETIDSVIGSNLTMDFLTDAEASKIGGIGMMPSFNLTVETSLLVSEPGHGTAPDLDANQINPGASLWAMVALLEHMGNDDTGRVDAGQRRALAKAAQLMNDGCTKFYSAGNNLTADLGGDGTTKSVGAAVQAIISAG